MRIVGELQGEELRRVRLGLAKNSFLNQTLWGL